jgi:Zn-dependent protease with chaperone function
MELEIYNTHDLKLLKIGGAVTGNSDDLANSFFNSKKLLGRARDVVVISTYLKSNLSLLEYQAIYYHELGHYVRRHKFNKNINNRDKELEADDFAASLVGAKNLLSALQKIPNILRDCNALKDKFKLGRTDTEYLAMLNLFLARVDCKMQYRYDALTKKL